MGAMSTLSCYLPRQSKRLLTTGSLSRFTATQSVKKRTLASFPQPNSTYQLFLTKSTKGGRQNHTTSTNNFQQQKRNFGFTSQFDFQNISACLSPKIHVPENGTTTKAPQNPVDVKKVLVIGSGGLSIGQAGEFDYSGWLRAFW